MNNASTSTTESSTSSDEAIARPKHIESASVPELNSAANDVQVVAPLGEKDLPELQEAELSAPEITRYLGDLAAGAKQLNIRVKDSPRGKFRKMDRLAELHRKLLEKHIWGAQIRYVFEGAEWTDTLIMTQLGTRIVRIAH